MTETTLEQKIEAILFYKAAPIKKSFLEKFLDISSDNLSSAIANLNANLNRTALRIVDSDTEVALVTAPEHGDLLKSLQKDDLKKEIGKAGAETLAIILYKGPISRSEIDQIRGVNSSYIIRNLLIRNLIERVHNSNGSVKFIPTTNLLNYLGITHKSELPDYIEITKKLELFEQSIAE